MNLWTIPETLAEPEPEPVPASRWLPPGPSADTAAMVSIAVSAVAAVFLLRRGVATVGGFVFHLSLVGAALSTGVVRSRQAWIAVGVSVVFAVWVPLRASAWLVPFNVGVAIGLLCLAVSEAHDGDLATRSLRRLVHACRRVAAAAFRVPTFVLRPLTASTGGERSKRLIRVGLGLAVAAPFVIVLTLLLASADAVFASLFDPRVSSDQLVTNIALALFGGTLAGALMRRAHDRDELPQPVGRLLGPTESAVVLGSVAVLFFVFVITQVVTAVGGADHIIETAGLTRAEYAREGFFQLLAVAAIAISLIAGVSLRRTAPAAPRHAVDVLAIVVALLTLTIVVVSIVRLSLYIDAFGLTMLRLYTVIFASWIGLILLVVAAHEAGLRRLAGRQSMVAIACGLGMLFGLNVVNPEAFVVRYNLDHGSVPYDATYGHQLSDDAVPALVEAARQRPDLRAALLDVVCGSEADWDDSLLGNRSSARAAAARDDIC